MKTTALILGATGSALLLSYSVPLAFFSGVLLPSPATYLDTLVIIVSGILGLFGGLCGAAGSVLALRDRQLSGILLAGAAAACAIAFASLVILMDSMFITRINKYAVMVTGVIASAALAAGGTLSLRGKTDGRPEGLI